MRACATVVGLMLMAGVFQGCGRPESTIAPVESPAPVTLPAVDGAAVLEHIKVLAADEYEGRAPGGKGEALTTAYLADQFRKAGLQPGMPDGTFFQPVPLVGITPDPQATLTFAKGTTRATLRMKDDFVARTKRVVETAALDRSEMIFVGYGVVAPEFGWDDYKGLDVKGKTLVMLVNDPPVPDPKDASKLDASVFGGVAMTYYGRWTYKYEIAAEKGAAGVLIVHETVPAGYPFEVLHSNVSESFDLVTPDKNMGRAAVEGWLTLDQSKKLLAMAGQDFEALKARARTREFTPVPLGVTASITIHNMLRTVDSRNVIGRLPGSDPKLKDEYVVFMGHWDHLGIGPAVNGDTIYNGAVDNASGCGGLIEIARALGKLPQAPKRSILFLAVTAEEQGLLGSEYYSVTPVYPLAKTLAAINMDSLNLYGRTKDLTLIGLGNSELDDYVANAAAEQGRVIKGDQEPEKGFYYRSDHFHFAKQGVPALDPHKEATEYVGKPRDFGAKVSDDYTAHDYHKPSDEVKPDWDMSGAAEDLQLFMTVGYRIAQADRYPEWKPGTEFKAIRERQLKAAAGGTN